MMWRWLAKIPAVQNAVRDLDREERRHGTSPVVYVQMSRRVYERWTADTHRRYTDRVAARKNHQAMRRDFDPWGLARERAAWDRMMKWHINTEGL